MFKDNNEAATLVQEIHATMNSIKSKNLNAAILRNLTDLRPVLDNKTRWLGKFHMVQRYCRIYDEIVAASLEDESSINISSIASFSKAQKLLGMLEEINSVTVALRERHLSLDQGRKYLNELSRQLSKHSNTNSHVLFGCKMKIQKAAAVSPLAPDHAFESGVCKIQASKYEDLSPKEEEACKCLLKDSSGIVELTTEDSPMKMSDQIKRMKEDSGATSSVNPYYDCSFIFCSSAEVERLWSKALYIYSQQRRRMTPLFFEAILYLKENRRFWDKSTVVQALENMKAPAND